MDVAVNFSLPDDIATQLQAKWHNLGDYARAMILLEAFRERLIGEWQLQQLLGFADRYELHGFLKAHQIPFYTQEDLEQDRDTSRRLGLSCR
jgi:hypothetical protein